MTLTVKDLLFVSKFLFFYTQPIYRKLFLLLVTGGASVLLTVLLITASWNSNVLPLDDFAADKNQFNCMTDQFVTFEPSGRLGNMICEYVHLLHIRETRNVTVANHPSMWNSLYERFPNISLKPLPNNCREKVVHQPVDVHEAHGELAMGSESSLIVVGTPCNVTDFYHLKPLWLRELRLARKLKASAAKRLGEVVETFKKQLPSNETEYGVTFVGVHVRRGDYQSLLDRYHSGKLLPPAYYRTAFAYYRQTFGSVLFVVLTEPKERKWCSENLSQNVTDVVVMDDGASQEQDLALLASFSHFVYSHGTFGLWGILLAHDLKTIAYPAQERKSFNLNRYAHYASFDIVSTNWTNVDFVKISFA